MKIQNVIVENETGMHARPAGELAKIASKYKSTINLIVDDKIINAKSILSIMSAGIKSKKEIQIQCVGDDEQEAIEEIEKAFINKLGE